MLNVFNHCTCHSQTYRNFSTRLQNIWLTDKSRLFSASLVLTHAKEKANYASASASAKRSPNPIPRQASCFALAPSSLAILPVRSTIEQKYQKIEGCEDSKSSESKLVLVIEFAFYSDKAKIRLR